MMFDLFFSSFFLKVPFFYFGKFFLLFWLYCPGTRGALYIHRIFSKIFWEINVSKLKELKEKIDKGVHKIIPEKVENEENIDRKTDDNMNTAPDETIESSPSQDVRVSETNQNEKYIPHQAGIENNKIDPYESESSPRGDSETMQSTPQYDANLNQDIREKQNTIQPNTQEEKRSDENPLPSDAIRSKLQQENRGNENQSNLQYDIGETESTGHHEPLEYKPITPHNMTEVTQLLTGGPNAIICEHIDNNNKKEMDDTKNNKIDTMEQHESRQNIVSDAKINTNNLQVGFQNIQEKFSESAERLKNLPSTKPLDNKQLLPQGMEIASNMRTNMDPNFKMHEEMAQGQEVPPKKVEPLTRDQKIDTTKQEKTVL